MNKLWNRQVTECISPRICFVKACSRFKSFNETSSWNKTLLHKLSSKAVMIYMGKFFYFLFIRYSYVFSFWFKVISFTKLQRKFFFNALFVIQSYIYREG